jgi:hypothetical protein
MYKDKSCVMVLELASWSLESSPELLSESSPEEMRSTTTLLSWSLLEESALTSMHVDRFFLWVEGKNRASQRWASLESANFVLARVYGYLPWPDEEPTSSMERRGRHTRVACGDDSLSLRNLTLLAGAVDSTEEEPPPRVAGQPCDGDKVEVGEGNRRQKASQSIY